MTRLTLTYRRFVAVITVAIALMATSCSSHRTVVRGSQGTTSGDTRHPGASTATPPVPSNASKSEKRLLEEAYRWLGTPYLYGGQSHDGADCSGFVMMVYKNALDIKLPRTSYDQSEWCKKIKKSDLRVGDLLFFRTGSADRVSHVGMYVGDGKMIHASSSRGVVIVDIDAKYWIDHFRHCGRVPK